MMKQDEWEPCGLGCQRSGDLVKCRTDGQAHPAGCVRLLARYVEDSARSWRRRDEGWTEDEILAERVREVLEKHPDLSEFGIRRADGWSDEQLEEARQRLLTDHGLDGIRRALRWVDTLERLPKGSRSRRIVTSYALKHYAEPQVGYFTNGAMIVAAVLAQVGLRISKDSPNPAVLVVSPDVVPSP